MKPFLEDAKKRELEERGFKSFIKTAGKDAEKGLDVGPCSPFRFVDGDSYHPLHIAATVANAAKPVLEALAKREVYERSFKSEAEKIGNDLGDVGT